MITIITEITDDVLTGYWDWRNAFYLTGEGKDRILANKKTCGFEMLPFLFLLMKKFGLGEVQAW